MSEKEKLYVSKKNFRKGLAHISDLVLYRGKKIILTDKGIPVAKLVPVNCPPAQELNNFILVVIDILRDKEDCNRIITMKELFDAFEKAEEELLNELIEFERFL